MESQRNQSGITTGVLGAEEAQPERRVWLAVLVQAVQEWRQGTLRARREAEAFLFRDGKDFDLVCSGAGLDASSMRARLSRLRAPSMVPSELPQHSRAA
jgi:hypothetical protein